MSGAEPKYSPGGRISLLFWGVFCLLATLALFPLYFGAWSRGTELLRAATSGAGGNALEGTFGNFEDLLARPKRYLPLALVTVVVLGGTISCLVWMVANL